MRPNITPPAQVRHCIVDDGGAEVTARFHCVAGEETGGEDACAGACCDWVGGVVDVGYVVCCWLCVCVRVGEGGGGRDRELSLALSVSVSLA